MNGRTEQKICLGGNDPIEGRGGASSMYLVFVGPEERRCEGVAAVNLAVAGDTTPPAPRGGGGHWFLIIVLVAFGTAGFEFFAFVFAHFVAFLPHFSLIFARCLAQVLRK